MAEKINLFELDIDTDAAVRDVIALKENIEILKAQTKKAKEEQGEFSAEYVKYSAALKSAQGEVRTQENLIKNATSANVAAAGSIDQLRKQLSVVSAQWAQLSKEQRENTEEGQRLTKQKKELTEALKGEERATGDARRNVGNYSEGLLEAAENSGVLSGGLKGAIGGMKAFTKASLAFIATPVGIVLAAIAAAFALIKNAMDRSEESTSKLKRGFAAFSGIATALLKFLEPLGVFLIDGLVKGFELVEKGLFKALNAIEKGLRWLGLDGAADSLKGFTDSVEENIAASKALTDAELEYAKAQRESRKVQLEYQKQAEKLRQIRDDESKSIQERIRANQQLGDLLQKQLADELQLAQKALDVAELRIQLEGETTEALDARAQAQTEIADIQERITGQESEQLTNRVSLEKEASEKILAIREAEAKRKAEIYKAETEAALAEMERELALEEERLTKERENTEKILAAADQARADQLEAARMDYENKLELARNNQFALLDLEREGLQAQKEMELEFAESIGADKALIEQKYAEYEKEIEREKIDAKIALQAGFAANLAQIFGEATAVGKAAAIAETTFSTFSAAQKAFSSLASIPVVGPALGAAAAGAAIAGGIARVKKIASTKSGLPGDKSGGGGIAGGGSSGGGMPTSVAPSVGQGLASRDSAANQASTIKQGFSEALRENPLQPTLVLDNVTANQSAETQRNETSVL